MTQPVSQPMTPLPCPFCGGEPDVRTVGTMTYVECKICHCASMADELREPAIAFWNRRVSSSPTATPSDNRFSHWATDLLTKNLREIADEMSLRVNADLLRACADRLDALYFGERSAPASFTCDDCKAQVWWDRFENDGRPASVLRDALTGRPHSCNEHKPSVEGVTLADINRAAEAWNAYDGQGLLVQMKHALIADRQSRRSAPVEEPPTNDKRDAERWRKARKILTVVSAGPHRDYYLTSDILDGTQMPFGADDFIDRWPSSSSVPDSPTLEPQEKKCPDCGGPLRRVTKGAGSMLNDDQFDSIRAGDWYCEGTCPSNGRGNTNYRYFWNRELVVATGEKP